MTKLRSLDEADFRRALDTTKKVIVNFSAPWCDSCRKAENILCEFSAENPDIDIYKLNVDDNMDITNHYGIMNVPTLLFFENKKIKNKASGIISKSEIEELLDI